MKKSFIVLSLLLMSVAAAFAQSTQGNSRFVDPLIGSGGHGHVFVGANVPFSLVQLGPTNPTRGWDWCSGYHYSDSVLTGFAMMHLSGTGVGDLGDIQWLPVSSAGQQTAILDHSRERVEPGYYSLWLNDPDVRVELTTTQRVGMLRFTYGATTDSALLRLDLLRGTGWDRLLESSFTQESPTRLSGFRRSHGWADEQIIFFAAEFSQPVECVFEDNKRVAVLKLSDPSTPLVMKVALSPVSTEGAWGNMKAEMSDWNFTKAVRKARQSWDEELSKIQIETAADSLKTVFYTALYHAMTAPSVFCDHDGSYRGADGNVHHGDFTNYTTLSLWDTYRAEHPLLTIIEPQMQADFAETFVNIYRQQGKLPVWHLMGNETNCMVGNPAIPVLADLLLKGFVKDKEGAFEAMRGSAMLDERGLSLLKEYGYMPYDNPTESETVGKGMEYAIADGALALAAKALGKKADYKYFHERSLSYKKYFDKKSQFMRPVAKDGTFREPFDPFEVRHNSPDYTEGNGWQYIWLVPHDVEGLISLFGSRQQFVTKLDSLFVVEGAGVNFDIPDVTGLIGQYAHGNEPSHHVIYLYNYVGMPEKSAPLLRRVMREMYTCQPDGLSGNEDVGQMSAWYVLSAVGLYQVEPAGGKYIIGSPVVDKATIDVGDGRTFTVTATDNSDENIVVKSILLNGKPYHKPFIMYSDIMKGGTLELFMGK